jgi:hypothetical protein
MDIIVRACGERTEAKCIELATKQGKVHVIRARPFGECIRQSYRLAMTLPGKWIPMVDADVLLVENSLIRALQYLDREEKKGHKIFCLDGKTKDKIMCCKRRAGIHIYRKIYLKHAMKYIDSNQLKPESHIRRTMTQRGFRTVVGPVIFGYHDYEQYNSDLWRKSFAQSQKLARKIKRSQIRNKWKKLQDKDPDFRVILAAHDAGRVYKGKIIIDKNIDYGAKEGLERLGIEEKGEL